MIPYKHQHVETFIEIISGHRNPMGVINNLGLFVPNSPLIKLARYDVSVVENLSQQSQNGLPYTDRQGQLAIKLILHYARQLAGHGIDVSPIRDNPEFRIEPRQVDRTARVWVDSDFIKIKFPFNPALIEQIRTYSQTSNGNLFWNHTLKVWQADLTENNVNWICTFAVDNKFEIDTGLSELMESIIAMEQTDYKIQLRVEDQLIITHAPESLNTYVEDNIGGFALANVLRLVDCAPLLGYTVDPVIEESIIAAYGTRFYSLCINKELKIEEFTAQGNQLETIVQYARETNRFPIFVYEPDLSNRIYGLLRKEFAVDEIAQLHYDQVITPETKLVHTIKIPKYDVGTIPLLISSAGMMFGGDRQVWIQSAEKIVYFSKEVYNKLNKKGQDLCKLD